jgi:hypothetical protein
MKRELNVHRVVLPDGTCATIEGGNAESAAEYVANKIGGKAQRVRQPLPKSELVRLSHPFIDNSELVMSPPVTPLIRPSVFDGPRDEGHGTLHTTPVFSEDAEITALELPPPMSFEADPKLIGNERKRHSPARDPNGITPLELPQMTF